MVYLILNAVCNYRISIHLGTKGHTNKGRNFEVACMVAKIGTKSNGKNIQRNI